ncbi:hypothetical protein ACEWY4_020192 [Coilia grayii]|uniref:Ubinuclein-1 n=1 Tax=Coilia grayii TaxID=363190 RepID=A0ABD1JC73_9TELE
MAQPRRIQLTTLPGDGPVLPASPAPKPPVVQESKPETPFVETAVRLELQLFSSDEHRCPEFYYPELVKANEARKRPTTLEELDAKNERDELEALARKFEAKYGGPDKPRKDRMSDLVDIGDGYDDEDSFIDNSEAYDEFVPSSLKTEHGGFYINCGTLKFRKVSCSDGDSDEPKVAKKRKLKDGGEQKLKKKKKKLEDASTDVGTPLIQESLPSQDPPAVSKSIPLAGRPPPQKKLKRPQSGPLSLDSVLRKLQQEKLQQFQSDRPLIAPPPTPVDAFNFPTSGASQSTLPAMLANQNTPPNKLTSQSPEARDLANQSPPRASVDPPESGPAQTILATPPHGLPSPLRASIRDLTQAARMCQGGSKIKFFSQEVNSILLDVEVRSRELGSTVRSRVFTHLSTHLPFSKDTLLKRARKLTLKPMIGNLPEALQKLKEAIVLAMPEQILRYQRDQGFTDATSSKANNESPVGKRQETGRDDDEGEMDVGKGATLPRKRFYWSEDIRAVLCEVVQIKMSFYEQEKRQKSNAEEYLKNFLEIEVKPLWPEGWMLTRCVMASDYLLDHYNPCSCLPHGNEPYAHSTLHLTEKVARASPPVISTAPSVDGASSLPSPSLGVVSQELGALSGHMKQYIQELCLPPAQAHSTASSPQLAKPVLGMACPDPSLVLQPMEPRQPLGPSPSPPPGQAAESEGGTAQMWPYSGPASFGALQASFPPASLPFASGSTHKGVNQDTSDIQERTHMPC